MQRVKDRVAFQSFEGSRPFCAVPGGSAPASRRGNRGAAMTPQHAPVGRFESQMLSPTCDPASAVGPKPTLSRCGSERCTPSFRARIRSRNNTPSRPERDAELKSFYLAKDHGFLSRTDSTRRNSRWTPLPRRRKRRPDRRPRRQARSLLRVRKLRSLPTPEARTVVSARTREDRRPLRCTRNGCSYGPR